MISGQDDSRSSSEDGGTDNAVGKCLWAQDGDYESDTWATNCGHYFVLIDGTPIENDMKFCCYCGRSIEECPQEVETDGSAT